MWTNEEINDVIGKSWELKGKGDPGFDCFTFIQYMYGLRKIKIPTWDYAECDYKSKALENILREAQVLFYEVKGFFRAEDFVVVANEHCGIMIDPYRVLMCDQKRGVYSIRLSIIKLPMWIGRRKHKGGIVTKPTIAII